MKIWNPKMAIVQKWAAVCVKGYCVSYSLGKTYIKLYLSIQYLIKK